MRLKISPYEAVKIIDELVSKAIDLLESIEGDYWKEYGKSLACKERERTKRLKRNNSPFGLIETDLQIPNSNQNSTVSSKVIECYSKRRDQWIADTKRRLEDIFIDTSPVYKFWQAKRDLNDETYGTHHDFLELKSDLQGKIDGLINFYEQISSLVRSPLMYIKEKAQIWFYDFLIPLTKDSNEAALCAFMFDFPVGQPVEFSEIYEAIKGVEVERPKNWQKVVCHAYDSINKKTGNRFGFPILKKSGVTLARSLPSRIVASL